MPLSMSSFLVNGESDFSCCFSFECFLLFRFLLDFLLDESSESDPVDVLELELEELELLDESEEDEEEVDEDLCRLFLLFRFFLSFFFFRLEWPFSSFGSFTSLDLDASPEIKPLKMCPTEVFKINLPVISRPEVSREMLSSCFEADTLRIPEPLRLPSR